MATRSALARERKSEEWSPARIYLLASGIFLIAIAAGGFAVNLTFPTDSSLVDVTSEHLFGVLETNGWHNLAAVVSALLAFGFAMKPEWARLGAFVKGICYVVATATITIWGGERFWIASNGADQVVHATLALSGLAAAALTRH